MVKVHVIVLPSFDSSVTHSSSWDEDIVDVYRHLNLKPMHQNYIFS